MHQLLKRFFKVPAAFLDTRRSKCLLDGSQIVRWTSILPTKDLQVPEFEHVPTNFYTKVLFDCVVLQGLQLRQKLRSIVEPQDP